MEFNSKIIIDIYHFFRLLALIYCLMPVVAHIIIKLLLKLETYGLKVSQFFNDLNFSVELAKSFQNCVAESLAKQEKAFTEIILNELKLLCQEEDICSTFTIGFKNPLVKRMQNFVFKVLRRMDFEENKLNEN
ncbi:hypothetical protein BpHYR1_027183 [Brachionus plicatilis]|uniref:Uncharacterized protein n=1 Tax=Brachionus plicatilis TaxID=10195 RepID=A0A3M7QP99_BRAPC|nr:hypothetical protein BpHYR1_027183 [Brachionus plicatilis]